MIAYIVGLIITKCSSKHFVPFSVISLPTSQSKHRFLTQYGVQFRILLFSLSQFVISLMSEVSITCCIILSLSNWWLNWWRISIFTTQAVPTRIIFIVKGTQNVRCHVPDSSCIFTIKVILSIAFFRCGVPTVDSLLKTSDVKSSASLNPFSSRSTTPFDTTRPQYIRGTSWLMEPSQIPLVINHRYKWEFLRENKFENGGIHNYVVMNL